MPVRKVGPNSYQWGTSGKVYTGRDAKAKAERQGRAIYASGYREAESYKPPASAVANAKRGLALRKEYGRGGLSPSEAKSQGIDSGVTRARKIASGKVSRHDVRRMSAFNRHRKNYRPDKKMPDGGPTAGTIAWLLWGGTSGVNWAKKKSASMNAEESVGDICPVCDEEIEEVAICSGCDTRACIPCRDSGDWSYDERLVSNDNSGDICGSCITKNAERITVDDVFKIIDEPTDSKVCDQCGVGGKWSWHPSAPQFGIMCYPCHAKYNSMQMGAPRYESNAEDYNSFTDEMDSLIEKYGVLQHYETSYYDNLMEVSFSFRPHDPYFDDVDFDAENWGGDPEGPLAKALARAREKLSQPRKPLRITSLPHPDQKTLKDFESDNWKLLPRDRMGRWRKPVDSESINRLTESLSSDVPSISELLTMYGGDTPTNRFRLYQDLQTLSIAQMDAALPDDSIVEFDETDLSWMTPEEYYQYVLEEPLNLSDDIEDDTQTVEFQDRLVRYTAMTMTPTEVDDLLEQNFKDVVADLFAPDSEDTEAEIAFLLAVKRYQEFSDRYAAE